MPGRKPLPAIKPHREIAPAGPSLPTQPGRRHCFLLLAKKPPPAVNPVARLKPEIEAQAIDGRHSGFVGGLASKPAGDQTECIGVISIHVLDDSWSGLSQRVG